MIVGATELIVSIGTGAPARIDSSKKTNCSIGPSSLPPHSFGHWSPTQPSADICLKIARGASPAPSLPRSWSSTSGVRSLS